MTASQTKLALYACAALLFFGGGALWGYAHDWGQRSRGVEVTLAIDAKGELVATIHNGTHERKEFFTSPHRLEVFEGGVWQVPQRKHTRPVCGFVNVAQVRLYPGKKAEFFVYESLDLVQPGQQVRVSICDNADFATGWVTSDPFTLARPSKALRAQSDRLRASQLPEAK